MKWFSRQGSHALHSGGVLCKEPPLLTTSSFLCLYQRGFTHDLGFG